MKVIVWPPYFFLIAGAFGTAGGTMAAVEAGFACFAGFDVPPEAMLSETRRASRATIPVSGTSTRNLT